MASKAYELATLARDATTLTGNAQTMGDANTLDGHDSSYFAVATHNHDSWYLKLEGGVLTGYVTVHATPTNDFHIANKKYVDDEVLSVSTALSSSKADSTHNHDSDYSSSSHNHNSDYSLISHHHDSEYLKTSGGDIVGGVTAPTPVLDTHIANKAYVDSQVGNAHTHTEYAEEAHVHADYALVSALNNYATNASVTTLLADKVDQTTYDDMVEDNADKTYVNNAIAPYATQTSMNAGLLLKADLSYVNTTVAGLANDAEIANLQSQVDQLSAGKATTQYVNSQLANYVDVNTYTTEINAKADAMAMAQAFALKADISYVDTKVADLVESAPQALNTLNELASALGDDADFSTTIATQIGAKADTSYVDTQIASLNSSIFSGSWNDITQKPSIPSSTSELTNDSNYSTTMSQSFGPYNSAGLASANGDGSDNHIGFITVVDTASSIQIFKNGIKLQGPIINTVSDDVPSVWDPVGYDYIAYQSSNDIVFESHVNLSSIDTIEIVVIYEV